ncbi:protein TESPA1 [Ornithorhynchus anatinus]|uniref:protein TESPA1 n=1 Tax=Ornithorhynchus anatinus TaxID=9258 RepID=UPI0010A7AB22|nr:protein TESPA1 [Ornithorhynchus anatinus]
MDGPSTLSPASWERRRAWLRQSRRRRPRGLEEEEEEEEEEEVRAAATAALPGEPEEEPPPLDDVFEEGSPALQIEHWLRDCGCSEEGPEEEPSLSITDGFYSGATSLDDDLTLGAEAMLLAANGKLFPRSFLGLARPGQGLHLGCSLSSAMTSFTSKTSSSISEILDKCQEDAEDVLFCLGFAQDERKDTTRIPARFFAAPSQAKGIDFRLFLKAQVRRIEMEDPCLMLASRFKQVQTLAVTADAFFCLYSYVSKTPVQKFTPSPSIWACSSGPPPRILAPEPEARSPVERLQRAVSRMCLYTTPRGGPTPRVESRDGSPGAAPTRGRLARVVREVMGRARVEELCPGVEVRNDPAEERETASPPASPRTPALPDPCAPGSSMQP